MDNLQWLVQYIRESQARYPGISKTPVNVLSHMLFCNGNGVELVDGNFVACVDFYRAIPFTEYYKEQLPFAELKEHLDDRECDREVEESFKSAKHFNELLGEFGRGLTEEEMWKEACEKFNSRYDELIIIDSMPSSDLQDVDKLVDLIEQSEYQPYLSLSSGYYKLNLFTGDTNQELLKVGVAMCKAYLKVLTKLEDNPMLVTKSPVLGAQHESSEEELASLFKVYRRDIETLKLEVPRLESYLKGQ